MEIEDEYGNLILDAVGTVEACRRVGIGRKTGYRWRAERGGLPPLRLSEATSRGRYLSRLEGSGSRPSEVAGGAFGRSPAGRGDRRRRRRR